MSVQQLVGDALWDVIQPLLWIVELTLAWISQCRPLQVRYERRADIHIALRIRRVSCGALHRRKPSGRGVA